MHQKYTKCVLNDNMSKSWFSPCYVFHQFCFRNQQLLFDVTETAVRAEAHHTFGLNDMGMSPSIASSSLVRFYGFDDFEFRRSKRHSRILCILNLHEMSTCKWMGCQSLRQILQAINNGWHPTISFGFFRSVFLIHRFIPPIYSKPFHLFRFFF